MKRLLLTIFVTLILAVSVVFTLRFVIGGDEDTWLCGKDGWQKHGNPRNPMPAKTCGEEKPYEWKVKLFLVALEDNGKSGKQIGCGDSLVSVDTTVNDIDLIKGSLTKLLSIKEQNYGESGLYNALYQSSLTIEDIKDDRNAGMISIYLTGNYKLGGTCDAPRFEEQLTATAAQFNKPITIYLNGKLLSEALSQK